MPSVISYEYIGRTGMRNSNNTQETVMKCTIEILFQLIPKEEFLQKILYGMMYCVIFYAKK